MDDYGKKIKMKNSRGKKVMINAYFGIVSEVVALICGLILPRLILMNYGSAYNGIASSIAQFISCISLMKAGVGGATRAALYKPLAEKDYLSISAIINQTQRYLRKVAVFYILFIFVFAAVYPIWISKDFDWLFSFSLILIISLTTFVQYYFGLAYEMVLTADMKQYVRSIIDIVTMIVNTIVAVILINRNASIHIVKLGSSIVHFIGPIFVFLYVKRKYHINKHVFAEKDLIRERWNAFGHEVANFINTNTDIMVLTIFSSMINVSIYTVYNYVIVNVRKLLLTFVTGFSSAFGNMYAKKEYDLMRENLALYELIMFSLVSVIYPVVFALIVPFVGLYTIGIKDANYIQPVFAAIAVIAGAFNCLKLPYQSIVIAAGDYKGTRNGAFIEACLNIIISIICVIKVGLIGVALGTLCAAIFRTLQYAFYISNHIIFRSTKNFFKHSIVFVVHFVSISVLVKEFLFKITSWGHWIIAGFLLVALNCGVVILSNYLLFKKDTTLLLNKTILRRK